MVWVLRNNPGWGCKQRRISAQKGGRRCPMSRTRRPAEPGRWRDGMGREVGGGFRIGKTCKSVADSYQCMAKNTTIKKKKGI